MNLFYAILLVVISVFILYLIFGFVVEKFLCHPKKRDYTKVKDEEISCNNVIDLKYFNYPFKEYKIKNQNGKLLCGHYFECKNNQGKYILFNHGYNYPYSSVIKYLPLFDSLNFNVLFPDHRGSGNSYKSGITFGVYECDESFLWMDFLLKIAKNDNITTPIIGIMGESMGASISLLMASSKRGKQFDFCIADCPFSSWKEIIKLRIKDAKIFGFKFLYPTIRLAVWLKNNADINKIDVVNAAQHIEIPTLIIHGLADEYVPPYMSELIAEKNNCIKLFLQKNAKHAQSISTDFTEYKKQILFFLHQNNIC